MKYLLSTFIFATVFCALVESGLAYNPSINETVIPYQIYVIDNDIKTRSEYLGTLKGDPHMYEFTLGAPSTLMLTLTQLKADTPIPFSLITVKQNNHNAGVVEVGRLRAKDAVWEATFDRGLGLRFLAGQAFEAELTPGVYRVEVSTPDNFGSYMLTVGNNPKSPGYFATLGDVRTIQRFFGKSFFAVFKSSYVYFPLGILLIVGFIIITRKRKGLFSRNHA